MAPDNLGHVYEHYDTLRKLGQGSSGTVCKGREKVTGKVVAIKTVPFANGVDRTSQSCTREARVMRELDHPNVVRLFETFADYRNQYLIMEFCEGGEVFERICESSACTEVQAASIMEQVFRALRYAHSKNICHRDLKPENLLFMAEGPIEEAQLKVCDFGLACEFVEGNFMQSRSGTPSYMAPEVLSGSYTAAVDLWSCGAILYLMISGTLPFSGKTSTNLASFRDAKFDFDSHQWRNISQDTLISILLASLALDAKDLVTTLLRVDPAERCTASQALRVPWVRNRAANAGNGPLHRASLVQLRSFRSKEILKKVALNAIAWQVDDKQIEELRRMFVLADVNGDGELSPDELQEGFAQAGLHHTSSEVQQIFHDCDLDGDGKVNYTEFLAATLDRRTYQMESAVWSAFRMFDTNCDGRIQANELTAMLESGALPDLAKHGCAEILAEVDLNGDGEITFDEFMAMMQS